MITTKLGAALIAVCVVIGAAVFSASASAAEGPSAAAKGKPKLKLEIVKPRQSSIAAKGVRVRITVRSDKADGSVKPRHVRLFLASKTFDRPGFVPLAEPLRVDIDEAGKQTVAVTPAAKAARQLAGCEARTLRARIRGRATTAELIRTGDCGPKPVDLSRAEDCDFIGVQAGSACMLPFPDDYYTCLLYTSPSPRDRTRSRMPSSA